MARIEDYALLGDLQTAALVSTDGLDRLAVPPAVRLPGLLRRAARHPRRRALAARARSTAGVCTRRRYRDDTLVLETEWTTPHGRVQVIDFMPPRGHAARHRAHRATASAARCRCAASCGCASTTAGSCPGCGTAAGGIDAVAGPDAVLAAHPRPGGGPRVDHGLGVHRARRRAGAVRADLDAEPPRAPARGRRRGGAAPTPSASGSTGRRSGTPVDRAVRRSRAALADHAEGAHLRPDRRHRGRRRPRRCPSRSAARATGTTATAGCATPPTRCRRCSPPATATRPRAWREWLLRAVAGDPADLQIMYGIDGTRRLPGAGAGLAARLRGLDAGADRQRGRRPAAARRLGRGARRAAPGPRGSVWPHTTTPGTCRSPCWSTSRAAGRSPTTGCGRCAGPRRHFTHSKVMAWVAADRMVRGARAHHLPGPVDRWEQLRDTHPRRRPRARLRQQHAAPSSSPTAAPTWTRACC